jgi:hypothetical protein
VTFAECAEVSRLHEEVADKENIVHEPDGFQEASAAKVVHHAWAQDGEVLPRGCQEGR